VDTIIAFINEHIFLVALLILTIIMLLVEEFRAKGALEPADAAILIQKGAKVLDVQDESKVKRTIEGAKKVKSDKYDWTKHKDRTLLIYCADGAKSKEIVGELTSQGIKEIYFIAGGLNAWVKDGFQAIDVKPGKAK
tara:strand:+ start:14799 stop:15209 length:411 start_codon:yes stop_codon:yes gene_type:complete